MARRQFEDYSQTESESFDYGEGWFEYVGEWEKVAEGVRCRIFAFTGIPTHDVDGAFVEILPGYRTPVQLVKSKHAFVEVPFEGRLVFLHVSAEGAFKIKYFDGDSRKKGEKGGEVFNEVGFGDLMCWYCLDDAPTSKIGKIVEYETPGFDSAELPTVARDSEEMRGKPIPNKFWEIIDLIDRGEGAELSANPHYRLRSLIEGNEDYLQVAKYMTWARIAAGLENNELGTSKIEREYGIGASWVNAAENVDRLVKTNPELAFELALFLTLLPASTSTESENFNKWIRGDGPLLLSKETIRPQLLEYLTSENGQKLAEILSRYMEHNISGVTKDSIFEDPSCFLAVATMYLCTCFTGNIGDDILSKLHNLATTRLCDPAAAEKIRLYRGFEDTAWIVEELELKGYLPAEKRQYSCSIIEIMIEEIGSKETTTLTKPLRVDPEFTRLQELLREIETRQSTESQLDQDDLQAAHDWIQSQIEAICTDPEKTNIWTLSKRAFLYGDTKGMILPQHLWWVGFFADDERKKEQSELLYLYHGTRLSRLSGVISSGGLRGFDEEGVKNSDISVTIDPIEAAFHAYYVGPHDTFRVNPNMPNVDHDDPVVVLRMRISDLELPQEKVLRINRMAIDLHNYQKEGKPYGFKLIGIKVGPFIPLSKIEALDLSTNNDISSSSVEEYFDRYQKNGTTLV